MTPFGLRVRQYRQRDNVTQKDMAEALKISPAYLSALEHGKRGRPSVSLLARLADYFRLSVAEVDDLEQLANLSHPRVTVDTSRLSPNATLLANELARRIRMLDNRTIESLLRQVTRPYGAE